jgi:Fe-S oxidoreductase
MNGAAAIPLFSGYDNEARELAKRNIEAVKASGAKVLLVSLQNATGCGRWIIKDVEYRYR